MTNKAEPANTPIEWDRLTLLLEVDYLDSLSEEEVECEMERDRAHLSELEERRLAKAATRLQRRVDILVAHEKLEHEAARGRGLRAAAQDDEASEAPSAPYAPLPREFDIRGRSFGLGVALERPREIVLLGVLPVGAAFLRIGERQFELFATSEAEVTRCRGLGEPQLIALLDCEPPPQLEIICVT